ncbi:MAG: insulinase family protein [Candidatus Riflebacteria bacterium]|nr:insulinase family protein [Candidatus Riflebacteria bacterium]
MNALNILGSSWFRYMVPLTLFFLTSLTCISAPNYRTLTLDNGLNVFVKEVPSAPVVAINTWIHLGSRNEVSGEEGYSHLIEHMLFKGTKTREVGKIDKEIKKLGATNNAFTSNDFTCIHVLGAKEHFEKLLELQTDAVFHSIFDPTEFDKELKVVTEELRMDNDDPESRIFNLTQGTAFTVHSYRHPVVGYKESLASATREKVFEFYKKYYVPGNMWMVVVGDVEADKVIDSIKNAMDGIASAPIPETIVKGEPAQEQRREAKIFGDIQQVYVNIAWHAPGISNQDNYAMDVISVLMGRGKSSRLYHTLVEKEGLASDLRTLYFTSEDPSLFYVCAQCRPSQKQQLIDRIISLFEDLKEDQDRTSEKSNPGKRGDASLIDEMEKAKQQLIASTIFDKETAESQAQNYGQYAILGKLSEADTYISKIKSVKFDDLKRIAKTYFVNSSLSVVTYEPSAVERVSKPEMMTLENDLKMILYPTHSTPLIGMTIQIDAGGFKEGKNDAGIANLTASTLLKGTDEKTSEEIAQAFESMGTSVSCKAQKSFTTIKMKCLSDKFIPSLDLLVDCLSNPSFPEKEIDKEKEKALEGIKEQDDDLFYYTYFKGLEELFPDSPLSYSPLGQAKTIKTIKHNEVKDFFKKNYVASNMVVSIVGDFYLEDVKDHLIKHFGGIEQGKASENQKKSSEIKEIKIPNFDKPMEVVNKKNREQSQTVVFFPTFPRNNPQTPAMDIIKSILSGSMYSRLFINLRDKESLAYSVWATQVGTRNTGYFFATISTNASTWDRAKTRLIEELKIFRDKGFTPEEFEDAKSYVVGQYALNMVDNLSIAETLSTDEFFGQGFDYYLKYPDLIKKLSIGEVKETAEKYFIPEKATIVAITKP